MNLKKLHLLGIGIVLLSFPSCTQDEDLVDTSVDSGVSVHSEAEIQQAKDLAIPVSELDNLSEDVKQKRYASIRLSEYIVLDGNQYKLDITEQQAQELGIDKFHYELIKNEISSTNKVIAETLEGGDSIELCDVQALAKEYKSGGVIISDESNNQTRVAYPSGNISTVGQEDGTASFQTEREHTKVLFRCRTAAAPTPVYRCTVTAWGEKKIGSKVGSVFTTTEITVPIAGSGSGVYADLTFATSDSNGGSCTWQAQ